jgi:hypothetical protein
VAKSIPRIVVLPVLCDRYGWPLYVHPVPYDAFDGKVPPVPPKTMRQIAREVSAQHGVPLVDMLSARRDRPTVYARQEAIYRMRTETLRSLPEIGRFFHRDHTTALHSVRTHKERMQHLSTGAYGDKSGVLLEPNISGVLIEDRHSTGDGQ